MIPSSTEIWLAPLRGFTDVIFRNIYASFFDGLDGAITPFLTTIQGSRIRPSHLRDVLPENNQKMVIVPQILSKTSSHFISMARCLGDMGYSEINWNLGCPYPMVAKKGRGAGMLAQPDKVAAFLEEVIAHIPNRLSIKLRLGYRSVGEIEAIFPIINQYPLAELIIHPRTAMQMYEGSPNEEVFGDCLKQTPHRIVYNGDIRTRDDFYRLQGKFPSVRKWMIGRGILSDPLLPARIRKQDYKVFEELELLQRFHDALLGAYAAILNGPGHLLSRMKGFWKYFSSNIDNGSQFLKKIQKTRNIASYEKHVNAFFDCERTKCRREQLQ
jgi:tRNA-dihydrouridine synthase B